MPAEGKHIYVLLFYVDVNVTDSLNCVGMEYYAFLLAQCANLGDRLNGTDLVIGVHYCDKCGVGADSVCYVLNLYYTVWVNGEICYLEALFLESVKCVQNCVVLKYRSDYMLLAFLSHHLCCAFYRPVIALTAAACEINFVVLTAERLCDLMSCLVYGDCGISSERVDRGWIAIFLFKIRQHSVKNVITYLSGSRIVKIYRCFQHLYYRSFLLTLYAKCRIPHCKAVW